MTIVLLGYLNARVGDEVVEDVIGRHSVPGRNENGERKIELCVVRELVFGNILFKKNDIDKYTEMR